MTDGLSFLPTQQSVPGPTDIPLATFQSYSAYTTSIYDYTTTITRIAYDPQGIAAPTQIVQTQAFTTTSIGYSIVYRPLLYTGPIPAPPLGTLYTTAGEVLITASPIAPLVPTPTEPSRGGPSPTNAVNTDQGGNIGNGQGDNSGSSSLDGSNSLNGDTGNGQEGDGNAGQQIGNSNGNNNGNQGVIPTISTGILTSASTPTPTPAPSFTSISTSVFNAASYASLQSSIASQASINASNAAISASQASISASNASQSNQASFSSISASIAASSASAQSASASSISVSATRISTVSPTATTATNGGTPTTRPHTVQNDNLSAGQVAGIVIGSVLTLLLLLLLLFMLCARRRKSNRNGGEEGGRNMIERWSGGNGGVYAAIGGRSGAEAGAVHRNDDEMEEDHLSGGDGSGFLVVGGRRVEGSSRTSLPRIHPNGQSQSIVKGGLAGLGAGIAAKFRSRKPVPTRDHDDSAQDWDHEDGELDRMIASDDDGDVDVTNGGQGRGLMSFDIDHDTSDVMQAGPSRWTTPPSLVPGHEEYRAVNNTTSSSPGSEGAWLAELGAMNPPPSYTEHSNTTQSDQQAGQLNSTRTDRIPSFNGSFGEGDLGLVQGQRENPKESESGNGDGNGNGNIGLIGGNAAALGSLDALAAGHGGSSIADHHDSSDNGHSIFISRDSSLLGPNGNHSRRDSRLPLATLASFSSQDDESSNSSNVRSRQRRYEDSSGSTGAASYSPSYLVRQNTRSTRGGWYSSNGSMSSREVARGGSSSNSSSSFRRNQRQRLGHADESIRASSYYPESDAQSSRATAGAAQDDQRSNMDPNLPLESVEESQEDQGNSTGYYYPSDNIQIAMQRRIEQEQRDGSWRPSPRVESLSQRAAAKMDHQEEQQPFNRDDTPLLHSEGSRDFRGSRVKGQGHGRGLLDRFLRPA